ncbi:hypothetical protein Syun_014389 [Stephania yunnanensis]|uniref:RING-type E3 ubiquitin transferase n=1 Tax=Stephania yunnanensis TaxID=152371 RepID=A0AAP0JJH3_9MAGN
MSTSPPSQPQPQHEPQLTRSDNVTRHYNLYLCYNCSRMVWLAPANPSEIICPRCSSEFLLELEETRPRLLLDLTNIGPTPEERMLEALTLMVDPRMNRERPRRRPGHPLPWIIFHPYDPTRPLPEPSTNQPGRLPPAVDPRNYFVGAGNWNQLIEELTENDRPGPPPASTGAIDALPTVKITPENLASDSNCPVCKEEFKVGGEVKELPCKHLYHSECIVPWLRIHNSCPVCRQELSGYSSVDESDEVEMGRVDRTRRSWWGNRIASLWPTRWRWWRYRRINPQEDSITATRRANSWWRSWCPC